MADESFEHFEQQERSWSALQEFGPVIAREAAETMTADPTVELAGLIVEEGASELAGIYEAIRNLTTPGNGIVAVVPREFAEMIVEANAGAEAAVWLRENAPRFAGQIPLVAISKDGFRLAAIPLT